MTTNTVDKGEFLSLCTETDHFDELWRTNRFGDDAFVRAPPLCLHST